MGQLHKEAMDFQFVHLCAFVFLRDIYIFFYFFFFKEVNVDAFLTLVRNMKRQN